MCPNTSIKWLPPYILYSRINSYRFIHCLDNKQEILCINNNHIIRVFVIFKMLQYLLSYYSSNHDEYFLKILTINSNSILQKQTYTPLYDLFLLWLWRHKFLNELNVFIIDINGDVIHITNGVFVTLAILVP